MTAKFILLVDDENHCIDELKPFFVGFGLPVKSASNGQEALEILEHSGGHCALLVTDLNMPVMNGLQLIFQIHKKKLPVRQVILNTSYPEDQIDLPIIQQVVRKSFQVTYSDKRLVQRNLKTILSKLIL